MSNNIAMKAAISAGVKVGNRRLDLSKRTERAMGRAYGGDKWTPEVRIDGVCAAARVPPLPQPETDELFLSGPAASQ